MKWNATTTGIACIAVGIFGFFAGKITSNSNTEPTEAELLLSRADQVTSPRQTANRSADSSRPAENRTRASTSRNDSTFDDRLTNMEGIIRGENALSRGRAMLAWIDSLAPSEFEAAVDRFRNLGLTQARMGEYSMLLTAWAELDPTAALAYATENTGGNMATNTVLSAWASRDAEAAVAWAKANHEGENANPHMVGIIRGLAETNPTRATELLQELPFSRERGDALAAMMPHLMQMGSESAKTWITNIQDERLRNGAIIRFTEDLAKQDPAGTAKWLLENAGESSIQSVGRVFSEWTQQDQSAALSYFERLPSGDARVHALRGMVTSRAQQDPAAAAQLMNQYPADRDDRTVQHFVRSSFGQAPEIAIAQINTIQDEENRNRTYHRALNHWLGSDPQAAQSWIRSARLPEDVTSRLNFPNQP